MTAACELIVVYDLINATPEYWRDVDKAEVERFVQLVSSELKLFPFSVQLYNFQSHISRNFVIGWIYQVKFMQLNYVVFFVRS